MKSQAYLFNLFSCPQQHLIKIISGQARLLCLHVPGPSLSPPKHCGVPTSMASTIPMRPHRPRGWFSGEKHITKQLHRGWQREVRVAAFSPFPRVKAGDLGAVGEGRWMSSSGSETATATEKQTCSEHNKTIPPAGPAWPLSIRDTSRAGGEAQDLLR